jgi:hypothetical protein
MVSQNAAAKFQIVVANFPRAAERSIVSGCFNGCAAVTCVWSLSRKKLPDFSGGRP